MTTPDDPTKLDEPTSTESMTSIELTTADEPTSFERTTSPTPETPATPTPSTVSAITCPHCQAPHDLARDGRFCNSCGMSVQPYVKPEPVAEGGEVQLVRCRYCGVKAPPPICPACGNRLPLPED